jgi:hypothetical protein
LGAKFFNGKKNWMEGTKNKKVPKQKLKSRLKKGKENKLKLPTTLVSTMREKKSH